MSAIVFEEFLPLQNIDYLRERLHFIETGILFFLIVNIQLFISAYLLIGDPVTIEGPICVFLGFCLVNFLNIELSKRMRKLKGKLSKVYIIVYKLC